VPADCATLLPFSVALQPSLPLLAAPTAFTPSRQPSADFSVGPPTVFSVHSVPSVPSAISLILLEIAGYFCSFWFGEIIQEFAFGLDSKVQVVKIVVTLKSGVGLSCFLVCWKVRSKTCLTRVE
jgi:hypothetical protein